MWTFSLNKQSEVMESRKGSAEQTEGYVEAWDSELRKDGCQHVTVTGPVCFSF